jgi:hypothetical protein
MASRMPKCCLVWMLLFALNGCRPKNQDMLVANVRGNYAYGVKAGTWNLNEVKDCGMANRAMLPDKRSGLLVCGAETQAAWDVVWLRSDIKSQILESARTFAVIFHSSGRSRRDSFQPKVWQCKRTSERIINCE